MNKNDKSILSITMVGHGMVHMYELAIPIFIVVWIQEFGANPAVLGAVVAAGYALYGVGSVPGGIAADTYGSKPLLVICLLGMGGSFALLGVLDGIAGVALALVMWGAAASIYHPAGLRLISTGASRRGTAFAYHGIAGNVGIAFGPLVAAVLLIGFDWRIVVGLMAAPALLAAVYTAYVPVDETAAVTDDETAAIADGGWESLRQFLGDTRLLFTGGFLIAFPMLILEGFFYRGVLTFLPDMLAGYESLAPVTISGRAVEPSQYVYIGLLVVGMAGQYVGGRLSERMAPEKALVGAFLGLGVISILFVPAAAGGLVTLLLITGILGFVLFGEQPLLQAVVADYSGSDVRGLSYGYMFLGVFGVGALGAAFSGALLAYTTQQTLFLLLSVVPLTAGLISAVLWRRAEATNSA